MTTTPKIGAPQPSQPARLDPSDILTPEQLAQRLQVSKSWVFEQTRNRAKVRNQNPLPCIRLGKYLRFSWSQVSDWLQNSQNNS
jgi:predicted DNA-binding transcriptional regulator AlpA